MPSAVVNTDSKRYELKSLEGGFVELKRMSYGQWLHRQELALRLEVKAGKGSAGAGGEMAIANKAVTQYEFQQCLVNHNLEDENGSPLDFRQITTLERLDPRIGNEIGLYISELHEFNSDELGNESAPALS